MDELFEYIFVEKDPVLISLIAVIALLIIAVIIGIMIQNKRNKQGIASYKVKPTFNQTLEQPVLTTDATFTASEKAQDNIFKKAYFIGKKETITLPDHTVTLEISRIKKEAKEHALRGIAYAYSVYFKTYEYSELPVEFEIIKHKKCDKISADQEKLALFNGDECVLSLSWDECFFKNTNYKLDILANKADYSGFQFEEANFTNDQYSLLEELLIKYGNAKFY